MAIKQKTQGDSLAGLQREVLDGSNQGKLNVLVYGDTGVGKTRLLGSAQKCPETSPIFYIAIDPGTESIKGSGIEVFRPQNFKEIQQLYNFLRFENKTFKSVALDSLTEMHDKLAMGEILGVLQGDASYSNLDNHVPATQYDWLQSGEQMRRNIRAFRDLAYLPNRRRRIHVFMTALARVDEKRDIICPALPGALGLTIGASLDILAMMSVQTVDPDEETPKRYRHLLLDEKQSEDGKRILAKARAPEGRDYPDHLWKPTVSKLIRFWEQPKEATA